MRGNSKHYSQRDIVRNSLTDQRPESELKSEYPTHKN